MTEELTIAVNHTMWWVMQGIDDFEQQCQILAASTIVTEIWDNFRHTQLCLEILLPLEPSAMKSGQYTTTLDMPC